MIVCGAPVPGQQFVETALWDVCDLRENIGEPRLGIDVVEPFDKRRRAIAVPMRLNMKAVR